MDIAGLHHVTAVTADAPENVAFYTQTLGMRLVKKTVNQDDTSAYHFFYGDALGKAGTEVTFFDWSHVPPHRPGVSDISSIGLRVAGVDALTWWAGRFDSMGVPHGEISTESGRAVLPFVDTEGQRLLLVDDSTADATLPGGEPWERSPVPADKFIRGLATIGLTVARLEPTARMLTDVMGMREARSYSLDGQTVTVFAMGAGGPGAELHVEERPGIGRAAVGAGGVHHVAFRTPNAETLAEWRTRVHKAGIASSGLVDRFYFKSLYFREPNGILFEIATDGPGFATDEDPEHLGEALSLPPFLEPHRAEIEAGLRPLTS